MPSYRQVGSIPRKRHTEHRVQPGYRGEGVYYEEVITTAGFGRAYSIAYHLRPPTRVRKVEAAGVWPLDVVEQPAYQKLEREVINALTALGEALAVRGQPAVNDAVAQSQRSRNKPVSTGGLGGILADGQGKLSQNGGFE